MHQIINTTSPMPSPITIEAESYTSMQGVQTEGTSDVGGGMNVGNINANDYMRYPAVTIPSSGSYTVEYRVASPQSTGSILQLKKTNDIVYGTVRIPLTGGWQVWTTVSHTVYLIAGQIQFDIVAIEGGWNFNWFRIVKDTAEVVVDVFEEFIGCAVSSMIDCF
jgi:hypothetical protein